jgi:tRNA A-37 threonylcarbamoyl transferase component Bud32
MADADFAYDVFVSCPMAGARTDQRYQDLRADALRVVDCLERECGLTAFYAGRDVPTRDAFDAPDYSVVVDLQALRQSRYFLLLYPEKLVSSVLVEAGIALALGKKAVYFARDARHLPFMLRHLDRVCPVKVYEYRAVEYVLKLLRQHGARLFEPWQQSGAPAGPGEGPIATAYGPPTPGVPGTTAAPAGEGITRQELRPEAGVGPYTLVRPLGAGACGVVWLAERRGSLATTQFALKFPSAGALDADAVRREARLWAQASGHPNVLPVVEADVYGGWLVIVSPYAPGGSLRAWLDRHGGRAPTAARAAALAEGILTGLGHLHGRGLVHRDLKPANVLLEGDSPRIADFGLARLLESCQQTLTAAGTPVYMAPEAWDGERSAATDLWSAGVLLYELLAGRVPFSGADLGAVRRAVWAAEPAPLPPDVPACLQTVVRRALSKDPGGRYPSAEEMVAALRKAAMSQV